MTRLNVARALVRTPLHIRHAGDLAETKLYFDPKEFCYALRDDILSGVGGRYENVERDVNIE